MKASRFILVFIGLIISRGALCQEKSIGLFNSPKGFGVTYSNDAGNRSYNSFSLYSDMTGVFSGKNSNPGIRFEYFKVFFVKEKNTQDCEIRFYAGPGVSSGYVRDYGSDIYGVLLALSGTAGVRFCFPRGIAIDLGLSADLGLHIRGKENGQTANLKFYRNGLYRIPYPQIKLEYCF